MTKLTSLASLIVLAATAATLPACLDTPDDDVVDSEDGELGAAPGRNTNSNFLSDWYNKTNKKLCKWTDNGNSKVFEVTFLGFSKQAMAYCAAYGGIGIAAGPGGAASGCLAGMSRVAASSMAKVAVGGAFKLACSGEYKYVYQPSAPPKCSEIAPYVPPGRSVLCD